MKGFNAVMDTNLNGTFMMCKEAYNQCMKDHGGSIVNIGFDTTIPVTMMGHSHASRAGVEIISKYFYYSGEFG